MAVVKPLSREDPEPLPFIDLQAQRKRIGDRIDEAMARVLAAGQYVLGPEVKEFETTLAQFAGAKHAISCANGTDALLLVLMAEDISPGDAVFVPSFTFVATGECVALRRATPVFVDVNPRSFNMDPASLERAIGAAKRAGLRPRMVIAVDLFGRPADYPVLREIADRHGLTLVADAAQSFGAKLGKARVGTMADYTTTSFFPAKPLGCYGDGGAILTDDGTKVEPLLSLRMHGKGRDQYDNVRIGLNSRLDTLQAAILIEKLRIFDSEIAMRNEVAARYKTLLSDIVVTPETNESCISVWAQYTILLDGAKAREVVQASCAAAGVPTAIYYATPLHRQSGYREFPADPSGLPHTDWLTERVLSLPMHPYLDAQTQQRIAHAVRAGVAAH